MLIPADIPRIARRYGVFEPCNACGGSGRCRTKLAAWAKTKLLASPGALLMRQFRGPNAAPAVEFRVRTLVPAVMTPQTTAGVPVAAAARGPGGPQRVSSGATRACVWYDRRSGRCGIHDIAPYGCAFFDDHMGFRQANQRSSDGLAVISKDWEQGGVYSWLWNTLSECGCVAPPPEFSRNRQPEQGEV